MSRSGRREADLLELVPRLAKLIDPAARSEEFGELKLAALRRSFRAHVVQRGPLAEWDFFHTQTRAAVLRRHAAGEKIQHRLHSAVADYMETLPAADPSNAGWQRDLWLSYYRMADMLERSGKKEATDWWRRAYAVLSSMKQRGLFISPGDEKFLDILRRKCS